MHSRTQYKVGSPCEQYVDKSTARNISPWKTAGYTRTLHCLEVVNERPGESALGISCITRIFSMAREAR